MTRARPEVPFDPGLQAERTLLAWKRTALALVVAGAVAVRFALHDLGPVVIVFGLAGLVVAAVAYASAMLRYRRVHAALTSRGVLPTGGVSIALMAMSALLVTLAGGGYLVAASLSRG